MLMTCFDEKIKFQTLTAYTPVLRGKRIFLFGGNYMSKFLIKKVKVAGFAAAKGFPWVLVPAGEGRADFGFDDTPELRATLKEYNDGGMIKANQYAETIESLQTALYSYKRS